MHTLEFEPGPVNTGNGTIPGLPPLPPSLPPSLDGIEPDD
jgi:hypothetical protein